MNTPQIDTIVERVLAGDLDAYEDIVRGYQREVWRVAAAMLLTKEKTEDLVQQTFINAFQHLDRYERGRDFGAWIKEIARNEVRQEIRRRLREDRRLAIYYGHLIQMYDISTTSLREERLEEALASCREKLPLASAKLVELRYDSALDFGQIASFVGRTVEATRQQVARIRLVLRDCIEKHLAKV